MQLAQVHKIVNFLPTGIPIYPTYTEPTCPEPFALFTRLVNTIPITAEWSIVIQKGINIKDRSAAHGHRLKLGNLRVIGMRVATTIVYW